MRFFFIVTTTMLILILVSCAPRMRGLAPGSVHVIEMPQCDPTLHALARGTDAVPAFSFQVPDDYDPQQLYPLRVVLPGNHGTDGRRTGFREHWRRIGDRPAVVAVMPLFRDPTRDNGTSPAGGLYLSFRDAPFLGRNLGLMLERLQQLVPNTDPEVSFIGGFSNGGHATGLLLSTQQEAVLSRVRHCYMIEGGVGQLVDLFAPSYEDRSLFMAVGQKSLGGGLGRLQFDIVGHMASIYDVELHRMLMWDTGHTTSRGARRELERWMATVAEGGDRVALREDFERQWAFDTGLAATYDTQTAQLGITIVNPFEEALTVGLQAEAGEPLWPIRGGDAQALIEPGDTAQLSLVFDRQPDDDDFARLPAMRLTGEQGRSLTTLVRRALGEALTMPELDAPRGAVGRSGQPTVERWYQRDFKRVIELPGAVWISWDEEALHLFFDCPEPAMDGVVAEQGERDGEVWKDDSVEVWIAASDERADRYQFAVSITGALYDHRNKDAEGYDSAAQVDIERRDDGWTAALSIPWSDLEPATGEAGLELGIRVGRNRQQLEDGQGRFPVLPGKPDYARLTLVESLPASGE